MADTKKSSSLEQQMAEDEIFCMVEDWLGCKVSRNPKIKMNNNDKVHIEPDFYSEEHSIIGEIFAHIGENKRGQSTKIANDILKMLLIEKDRCKSYRKIIVVCDEQEERDLDWDDLPTESIMLAYREDNGLYSWKKSDPRLLNLYFMNKDDDDRAIYRILKGWRDFNFQDGKGPSSIFLMSLAEKANAGKSFTDDISAELLKVLRFIKSMALPDGDEVSVENPADPKEGIKCPKDKFEVLQSRAGGLASAIAGNMDPSDAARSQAVQCHLGKRFPVIKDSVQINRRGALPSVRAG